MAGLEAKDQSKILAHLEEEGAWVIKTQSTNKNGTPDILGCLNGRFIAVEVKTTSGTLSRLQELKLQQIERAGGIAFVAYGYQDFVSKWRLLSKELPDR